MQLAVCTAGYLSSQISALLSVSKVTSAHEARTEPHSFMDFMAFIQLCASLYCCIKTSNKSKEEIVSCLANKQKRNSGTREAFARLHFQKVNENYCLLSQFSHSIQIIYSLKIFCLLKLEESFQVLPLCQVKAWIQTVYLFLIMKKQMLKLGHLTLIFFLLNSHQYPITFLEC